MPLTKEQLDRWVKALRDNPTLQGKERLKTPLGKFCCLGMLCEVEGLPAILDHTVGQFYYDFGEECKASGVLTGKLARQLGSELGTFQLLSMPDLTWEGKTYQGLAKANDAGVPWAAIADHLEKHYPYEGRQDANLSAQS